MGTCSRCPSKWTSPLETGLGGGKHPRLSLPELGELGVDMVIGRTPCVFAAHEAIDSDLADSKAAGGRLPELRQHRRRYCVAYND